MDKKKKKWKDALLKSSLPLEHLAAEVLDRNDVYVSGEYTYSRFNEIGEETTFSVDLSAFKLFDGEDSKPAWGCLDLLIECKYSHPQVMWVFAPHTSDVVVSCISVYEDLCTQRIESKELIYQFDENTPYCYRGVQIHPDGSDLENIPRGLNQLRFASTHYVQRLLRNQLTEFNDEDLLIHFYCPILLTTAHLYVLKEGLSIRDFQHADKIDQVATSVESLVSFEDTRQDLTSYNAMLFDQFENANPTLKSRLEDLLDITKPDRDRNIFPPTWNLRHSFLGLNHHVLVVKFTSLENLLSDITDRIRKIGKKRRRIAHLRKDMRKRETWIEALSLGES